MLRRLFVGRSGFLIACLMAATAASWAQSFNVTKYFTRNPQGGVGIEAEYDLGPDWDCCPPEDIRWMQRIVLRDANGDVKNNVPGYPNGDFIDPIPDQAGGPWDTLPWYDVTYTDAAHTSGLQRGKGKYMEDYPSGWGPFGPMSFNAQTFLVCVDEDLEAFCFIAGFTWGFSVAADGTITRHGAALFGDSPEFGAGVNAGLDRIPDFEPWDYWGECADCPEFTLTVVPEPTTMTAMVLGVLALARRRKRA